MCAGVHSGAVYTDPTLWRMGLIGEGTFDRTVIAVKSHYSKGVNYRDSRPRFQLSQYDQVWVGGWVGGWVGHDECVHCSSTPRKGGW